MKLSKEKIDKRIRELSEFDPMLSDVETDNDGQIIIYTGI